MSLYVTRLGDEHVRTQFTCGQPSLDDWFRLRAGQADRRQGSARVYVLVDDEYEGGSVPLGFYSLSGHSVAVDDLPGDLAKQQPPYFPVGAILLGRLAIDQRHQGGGRRLGETLLADAVRKVIDVDKIAATPLMLVDALNADVSKFYRKYGFVQLLEAGPDRIRLGARLKDIRKTFGL